jgi:BspA type Leucine rich repeat region (6 copies)
MDLKEKVLLFLVITIRLHNFVISESTHCEWIPEDIPQQNFLITDKINCSTKINLELKVSNWDEVHIKCLDVEYSKFYDKKTGVQEEDLKLIPPYDRKIETLKIDNCRYLNEKISSLTTIFHSINQLEVNAKSMKFTREFFDDKTSLKKIHAQSEFLRIGENFLENLPEIETLTVKSADILGEKLIFANAVKLVNLSLEGNMHRLRDNSFYNSTNIEHLAIVRRMASYEYDEESNW